jgi:hypothetical protein
MKFSEIDYLYLDFPFSGLLVGERRLLVGERRLLVGERVQEGGGCRCGGRAGGKGGWS